MVSIPQETKTHRVPPLGTNHNGLHPLGSNNILGSNTWNHQHNGFHHLGNNNTLDSTTWNQQHNNFPFFRNNTMVSILQETITHWVPPLGTNSIIIFHLLEITTQCVPPLGTNFIMIPLEILEFGHQCGRKNMVICFFYPKTYFQLVFDRKHLGKQLRNLVKPIHNL